MSQAMACLMLNAILREYGVELLLHPFPKATFSCLLAAPRAAVATERLSL